MLGDTIAAISTPFGEGGIAVIRVSGCKAKEICSKVFRPRSGGEPVHARALYGDILAGGRVIDDGMCTFFESPHSFTGEDTAELSCHGGVVVTAMVLQSVIAAGARQAQAGEFTRRAFLNGKLSLTEAEGVAELLEAKTETAAELSSSSARGRLSHELGEISAEILALTASLFAYIDYPDEDMEDLSDEELARRIDALSERTRRLADSYRTGKAITEGVPAMIVGRPNVGKSSLFNSILGENKAIVTDISGTTRDIIEYPARAGRILLRLCDTAGVRETPADEIERRGIELVRQRLQNGEVSLVFALFDGSRELSEDDRTIIRVLKASGAEVVAAVTKSDLDRVLDLQEIERAFGKPIFISHKDSESIGRLLAAAERLFTDEKLNPSEDAFVTNARQKGELDRLSDLFSEAKTALESGQKDIMLIMLEKALTVVEETDGRGADERIVNEIFSHFCVGK